MAGDSPRYAGNMIAIVTGLDVWTAMVELRNCVNLTYYCFLLKLDFADVVINTAYLCSVIYGMCEIK